VLRLIILSRNFHESRPVQSINVLQEFFCDWQRSNTLMLSEINNNFIGSQSHSDVALVPLRQEDTHKLSEHQMSVQTAHVLSETSHHKFQKVQRLQVDLKVVIFEELLDQRR
jgi:hypothetical protein